jgi:serine/threonine protein kinase
MATGALPFRGESSGVIFEAVLNRAPVPPVRLNPDLPIELERTINKALEKDRNLRYQHASDVRTDLERLKRDTDSAPVTVSAKAGAATASGLRWKLILPAAVAVLALSVTGYFYFTAHPSSRRRTRSSSLSSRTQPETRCLTAPCGRGFPYNWISHPS